MPKTPTAWLSCENGGAPNPKAWTPGPPGCPEAERGAPPTANTYWRSGRHRRIRPRRRNLRSRDPRRRPRSPEPCGMPRRLSRASVVRVFRPRSSVSSTGQSRHILIRCSTRRSTMRRATDLSKSECGKPGLGTTCRGRRREVLSESRMQEICLSGSMGPPNAPGPRTRPGFRSPRRECGRPIRRLACVPSAPHAKHSIASAARPWTHGSRSSCFRDRRRADHLAGKSALPASGS